jgi:FkbM family methyltransferase
MEHYNMFMLSYMKCRHGIFSHDDRDDTAGRALKIYGELAEEEIYLLSTLIRQGDVVLDIGANVGTHAIPFGRMVGPSGRVIAVDGQSAASTILAINVALNSAQNIQRIEGLVGDSNRTVFNSEPPLATDSFNLNLGAVSFRHVVEHVAAPDQGDWARPLTMFTIDSLNRPKCRLLKIDVEGMEFEVLFGAVGTIERTRPFIYFEQNTNEAFPRIFDLLSRFDYTLYEHVANPFNRNNFNRSEENIWGGAREINVLAVPPETEFAVPSGIALTKIPSRDWVRQMSLDPNGWELPNGAYSSLAPVSYDLDLTRLTAKDRARRHGVAPDLSNR